MNWQYGVHPAVLRHGDPARAMERTRAEGHDSLRLLAAPEQETEARKDPPWFLRRIRQQKGGDEDE